MIFKTQWNAKAYTNYDPETGEQLEQPIRLFPDKYEVNNQPSMTIPDQSMSIREIMERYAKGLPLDGQRVPMYMEDENDIMPELQYMDLAEIQELKENNLANIARIQNELMERSKREKAQQGSKVQRTSGEADDQGSEDDPDPNILKKPGVQGQSPATKQKKKASEKGDLE